MTEQDGPFSVRALTKVLVLLIPVGLILGAVRILLLGAPVWVPLEYRMPGFPPDRYGFSTADRIRWSAVDIEFLLGDYELSFFDDYTLPSGEPMHNARELSHMEDVKRLVDGSEMALYGVLGVVLLALGLLARLAGTDQVLAVLQAGARATGFVAVGLALGLLVAFGALFVGFHQLFFEPGTWVFYYSDTFIRLYPERFWRDSFVLAVVITGLLAGLLYWLAGVAEKRRRARRG